MKKNVITILLFLLASAGFAAASGPKREFRGAWLQTVWQDGYRTRTTAQNKAYLRGQLDKLKAAGVNAVLFQVRPQSDAFYDSKIEPWSRFLTDGGAAPKPWWDPLEFMVEECHARGMELHAWLNPYRVTGSAKQTLPRGHVYHKHPERFVRYDGKLYFDPGLPENREFIVKVVDDIISRYDVDGIHFDDYFYPYPVKGKEFADSKAFARYGKGMKLGDWRRRNVDMLIDDVHECIHRRKPWVRFGVSPFGIWRNKKTDPRGSDTNGLQNYDALYADVLLWEEKGWIDYLLPQLYWDLGHKSASYLVLVDWWNRNAGTKRHLYIGQDAERTMKSAELRRKVELTRSAERVRGNCWWSGYSVTANKGGVADSLAASYQSVPALVPSYPWISGERPAAVSGLKAEHRRLSWKEAGQRGRASDAVRYAVYRFDSKKDVDTERDGALVAVVGKPEYEASGAGVYVVTALSRVNIESEPSSPVVIR